MSLLERLRKLEDEASLGPWEFVTYSTDNWGSILCPRPKASAYSSITTGSIHRGNAQLIVEMRNSIKPLLDRMEKLEAVAEAVCLHMDGHISWSEVSKVVRELRENEG